MTTFLEKLLSFKIIILAAILLVAAESYYLYNLYPKSGWYAVVLTTAIPLAYALGQLEVCWYQCIGHGTTHPRKKICRFPILPLIIFGVLLMLCLLGIKLSLSLVGGGFEPSSAAKCFVLFFNISLGTIVSASRWYVVLYFRHYVGSQMELLQWLESHNIDPSVGARVMKYHQDEGFVNSGIPVPKEAIS